MAYVTKQTTSSKKKLRVGFILGRSFTLSAFAMFIDTLRLASDEFDRSGRILADWQVLGSTRQLVTSSCGVQVATTSELGDPSRFDYIIVVGGLLTVESPIDNETTKFLRMADAKAVPLIGLCTGSFILADAGLMKAHQTCVSWLHYQTFRERFPDHKVRGDRLYNLDHNRGSCAGGSSSADLAALIVRRHISTDAERNAFEVLQIDRIRSASDIQPRRPLMMQSDDPRIQSILIAMDRYTDANIPIKQLAGSVGLSRRQLERLFRKELEMSPAQVYKKLRLERAKRLLNGTKASLVEIALEVGFENASHFGQVFRKTYGQSPGQWRSVSTTISP